MFKKVKSADTQKQKQLSLFDFLNPPKRKINQPIPSINKKTNLTNQNKKIDQPSSSITTFSKISSLDHDIHSCPSPSLESLNSSTGFALNASESAPTIMEEFSSLNEEKSYDQDQAPYLFPESSDEEILTKNKNEEESLQQNNSIQCGAELSEKSILNNKSVVSSNEPISLGFPFDQLSKMPKCSSFLPLLNSTSSHTVLFDTTFSGYGPPPPKSCAHKDAWDSDHVRLPCSPKNLYPIKKRFGRSSLENRWELLESSLLNQISSTIDLEEAILTYNSRYSNQWSFFALHKFFIEDVEPAYRKSFFDCTLPKMVQLALMMPKLFPEPIPLLSRQKNHTITMTQQQVACLLCNAFFCTFPWRNSKKATSEYFNYPDINFNRLFMSFSPSGSVVSEKLKMLIHYFERVTTEMPCGTISFERRCLKDFPLWAESPCTLGVLHVRSHGKIEKEGSGMLQVDFANRFIGGGVLGLGAVQEEIRFCICPELIVTRLFCEALENNECIVITGAEQYSQYSGYRNSLKYVGNHDDVTPRDEWKRRQTEIVAIDAIFFSKSSDQFTPSNIRRELNKAFCGFYCDPSQEQVAAVATGNWGCGAFRGNPVLKGLIQMMATSALGRELCYFAFEDVELVKKLHEMHSFIKEAQLKLSDLWHILIRYHSEIIKSDANEELFEFIQRICKDYDESTDESDVSNNSLPHAVNFDSHQ